MHTDLCATGLLQRAWAVGEFWDLASFTWKQDFFLRRGTGAFKEGSSPFSGQAALGISNIGFLPRRSLFRDFVLHDWLKCVYGGYCLLHFPALR